MEKIVLSRPTYNRLSDGANLAQDLANKATSPRGITPAKPQHKHYMARLTTETTVANGGLTWQAEEVYLDAVGAVVAKVGGFLWTDDNPVFTLNAATALDVIMVSQAGRPAINPDPAKRYWFGNPGGGGSGGMFRLLVNTDFTLASGGFTIAQVDLVDDQNNIITLGVSVTQRKFTEANFYAGEILYGIDYSLGSVYLLDPFLAGIGGV
tara:strand:- start:3016 stop:3642 length:627 start_codon:yes stop_codon:yes gene_type:complete